MSGAWCLTPPLCRLVPDLSTWYDAGLGFRNILAVLGVVQLVSILAKIGIYCRRGRKAEAAPGQGSAQNQGTGRQAEAAPGQGSAQSQGTGRQAEAAPGQGSAQSQGIPPIFTDILNKYTTPELNHLCQRLDIHTTGSREDLVKRLLRVEGIITERQAKYLFGLRRRRGLKAWTPGKDDSVFASKVNASESIDALTADTPSRTSDE